METCFNYTDREKCWMSSDERRWITKIRKLADEHPEEVRILKQPEDNDGCIYATLPPRWLKLAPPRVFTDEQRQEIADRLAAGRKT